MNYVSWIQETEMSQNSSGQAIVPKRVSQGLLPRSEHLQRWWGVLSVKFCHMWDSCVWIKPPKNPKEKNNPWHEAWTELFLTWPCLLPSFVLWGMSWCISRWALHAKGEWEQKWLIISIFLLFSCLIVS